MTIETRFDSLTERCDHIISQWYALPFFLVTLALIWWLTGADLANFYISIVTVLFFFVLNYGARKDRIALHKKLDEVLRAIVDADDTALAGAEKHTLSELEREETRL